MAILGSEGGNKHEISMPNKMITFITWILFLYAAYLILLVIISISFSHFSRFCLFCYCKKLLKNRMNVHLCSLPFLSSRDDQEMQIPHSHFNISVFMDVRWTFEVRGHWKYWKCHCQSSHQICDLSSEFIRWSFQI